MTLYYSLVFLLLVTEMVIFLALIVPLPFTWRRKLFTFISESPIVAKLQYGMKITFIFILILFIDSVNRVYRVGIELSAFSKSDGRGGAAVMGGSERMEVQARKFYSQRNMYLCGFTLFLSLILNRTYVMILDVLRLEEEVKSLKGDPAAKGKGSSLQKVGNPGEIGRLKEELAAKDRDMANLKKQVENMQNEYNRMGDQVSGSKGTPSKDR
ncbi:endoplasmic reticulum protein-like protein [Zopfia rhizophila CBS 207.26]|uniref:Endoplasmic reticulum transmembrane protein n=1 Tax=Zopfia rhizophila CBS 207.26 TaxID=1314779 RepID=A0A6A6DE12_9PEZI|nr:endoplasmic reticulum protein-like protein [Zopfia rhizophila CBS 207.26]